MLRVVQPLDVSALRAAVRRTADREGRPWVIVPHSGPGDSNPLTTPYAVPWADATGWERENAVEVVRPGPGRAAG